MDLGQYSEITGSTHTKYLQAGNGLPTVMSTGSFRTLKYLMTDGLGSVTAIFDGSGHVQSQTLYAPYGGIRYASGSSGLTSKGFTGQRADSYSGLDYYNARYYEPTAGQFASADTMQAGLNRFGYVGGNPTTMTDPSGHHPCAGADDCGGYGGGDKCSLGNCHKPPCTKDCDRKPGGGGGIPGCKGTVEQCATWGNSRDSRLQSLSNNENGAWAILGIIMAFLDIWDLVLDKSKGFLLVMIDIVSLAGDALFTANYALQWIQGTFGISTLGLRHVVDVLSTFVNAVAGPLKASRQALYGIAVFCCRTVACPNASTCSHT